MADLHIGNRLLPAPEARKKVFVVVVAQWELRQGAGPSHMSQSSPAGAGSGFQVAPQCRLFGGMKHSMRPRPPLRTNSATS